MSILLPTLSNTEKNCFCSKGKKKENKMEESSTWEKVKTQVRKRFIECKLDWFENNM